MSGDIQRLYDRIAELEDALGMTAIAPERMHYSTVGRKLLGLLIARPSVPYNAAFDALYGSRPECDHPNSDTLKVIAHRLRCRLARDGITIRLIWGVGWYLEPKDRERAAKLYGTDAALVGSIWRAGQQDEEAA